MTEHEVMDGPATKLYESFGEGLKSMFIALDGQTNEATKVAVGLTLADLAKALDKGHIPEPRFPIITIREKVDEAQHDKSLLQRAAEEASSKHEMANVTTTAESVPEDTGPVDDEAEAPAEETSEEAEAPAEDQKTHSVPVEEAPEGDEAEAPEGDEAEAPAEGDESDS